jgi:16S rRNA U516 pseudouridylate synthase RsuA-like enzyme
MTWLVTVRGEQKTEKQKKKITEKTEPLKKHIKPIKILKKPAGLVRFHKKKTENPNLTQTEKNRAKPKEKLSQTGQNQVKPV